MALDHLLQEVSDDLLLEDGGWILLESASNPSFRARVEDFSGSYVEWLEWSQANIQWFNTLDYSGSAVAYLEQSEQSIRLDDASGWFVTFVDASEGVQ